MWQKRRNSNPSAQNYVDYVNQNPGIDRTTQTNLHTGEFVAGIFFTHDMDCFTLSIYIVFLLVE